MHFIYLLFFVFLKVSGVVVQHQAFLTIWINFNPNIDK